MAVVVFLRGVNVGGHRRFRPSLLCQKLEHVKMVTIGAAGTFVVRGPITLTRLRFEISRHLPFEVNMIVCHGREINRLRAKHPAAHTVGKEVRFVSILARKPRMNPKLPIRFPERGRWLLRVLAREGRFVYGAYRRDMRVISYLSRLDRTFGVRLTTRNWNTMRAIAKILTQETERPITP